VADWVVRLCVTIITEHAAKKMTPTAMARYSRDMGGYSLLPIAARMLLRSSGPPTAQ
jgi:hypothetical protein